MLWLVVAAGYAFIGWHVGRVTAARSLELWRPGGRERETADYVFALLAGFAAGAFWPISWPIRVLIDRLKERGWPGDR